MSTLASLLVPPARVTLLYAEGLLKDVTPAQFARCPMVNGKPLHANHPAWVYGHLSVYAERMMALLGQPAGVTANPPGFMDMFKNGTECRDDPAGTIYPPMDRVVKHYFDGYRAVIDVLPRLAESAFTAENPAEGRFKEMFPTIGAAVAFLLAGHAMSHLGQVSTWRRCMGLGSAS